MALLFSFIGFYCLILSYSGGKGAELGPMVKTDRTHNKSCLLLFLYHCNLLGAWICAFSWESNDPLAVYGSHSRAWSS